MLMYSMFDATSHPNMKINSKVQQVSFASELAFPNQDSKNIISYFSSAKIESEVAIQDSLL